MIMRNSAGSEEGESTGVLYDRIEVTSDVQLFAARAWSRARCARRWTLRIGKSMSSVSFVWRLRRESL